MCLRVQKKIISKGSYLEGNCHSRYILNQLLSNIKIRFSVLETAGFSAALEVITKVAIYYFHERIYNSLSWVRDVIKYF